DISPDNKRILFLANLDEDSDYTLRNDLYELEFANNDIKKLTNEKHDYNKANYSPDGEKIVLIGNERDYRGATQDDIYVLEGREGFFQQLSETWDFQIGDVLLGDMRLGEAGKKHGGKRRLPIRFILEVLWIPMEMGLV